MAGGSRKLRDAVVHGYVESRQVPTELSNRAKETSKLRAEGAVSFFSLLSVGRDVKGRGDVK